MGDRCQAPASTSTVLVRCGHFFTNWIYDFQTLISGVFALIAASVTIYIMHSNTQEISNAKWRTTINNSIACASQLEATLNIIDKLKEEYKWDSRFGIRKYREDFNFLISMAKRVKHILQVADEFGLSVYTAYFIRQDIDTMNELIDYTARHYTDIKQRNFTDEIPEDDAYDWNRATLNYLKDMKKVREQTLAAFKLFLKNQHKHNPRNLAVLIDS